MSDKKADSKTVTMLVTVPKVDDLTAQQLRASVRSAITQCGDFYSRRVSVQTAPRAKRPNDAQQAEPAGTRERQRGG